MYAPAHILALEDARRPVTRRRLPTKPPGMSSRAPGAELSMSKPLFVEGK